jgi:hypothetical protein
MPTGDGRSSAVICRRMSANKFRGTATSAIWKATWRPWLTTFAPVLISFSLGVVSEHAFFGSSVGRAEGVRQDHRERVKLLSRHRDHP